MQAGRLDRRITIERKTTVPDEVGDPVESWAELSTRWANVKHQGGREFLAAGAERTEARTVFTIRYFDGLRRTDRINYDGAIYDVEAINELGRREGQQILAVARR